MRHLRLSILLILLAATSVWGITITSQPPPDATGGTAAGSFTTLQSSGAATLATVDGPIGSVTPAAGLFTTLGSSGNTTLGDATGDQITLNGFVISQYQPSFLAHLGTGQTNVTGDSTSYSITGAFWTERTDQGNDFLNGTFTAPKTANYQLNASFNLEDVVDATLCRAIIGTSNRDYDVFWGNALGIDATGEVIVTGSVLADMDAGDTAVLKVLCSGGTRIIDVFTLTHFSGFLAN